MEWCLKIESKLVYFSGNLFFYLIIYEYNRKKIQRGRKLGGRS